VLLTPTPTQPTGVAVTTVPPSPTAPSPRGLPATAVASPSGQVGPTVLTPGPQVRGLPSAGTGPDANASDRMLAASAALVIAAAALAASLLFARLFKKGDWDN
jgi:hypothetical protein